MKSLKEYIVEGILDIDDNERNFDKNIKEQIMQFIEDNFNGHATCEISKNPNSDGKYEVSSKGNIEVENRKITLLTNGLFVWSEIGGDFNCKYCRCLTSLEGAPNEVGGDFSCGDCYSLTSLKDAPEKVGGGFSCNYCDSLKTLEGAPKEVGGYFNCHECGKQFTEKDIKKVSNVKGKIYC